MPAVTRLGDTCTGHGCWPPRPSAGASPDVFVDGRPVHRVGDAWAAHTCPDIPETHAGALAAGSPTVFVNGRPAGRIGDPVSCGSAVATGSGTVFADRGGA
ncbi:PAAR domain-containing protein [Azospirillum halopraeferens]|uniref:PAAR domain-containing protein n=1 Tax=Azospirillum halopraeferens TaxID=34010 RepID=UPI00040D953C|nr:PAAR domain-containing protein [Azospirillum halopraeferens]